MEQTLAMVCPIVNYKQTAPGGTADSEHSTADLQIIPESTPVAETTPEEAILCLQCRHEITSRRQKITRHGAHEHTFVNPAGHIFHLACFKEASGCLPRGELTEEHTWFQGFAWNYALCGQCLNHLGWVFYGKGSDRFFGLITDKLIIA
jgi:hypothetical protein